MCQFPFMLPLFRPSFPVSRPRLRARRGFSLVEVVLAVGILSCSLVTMLALVPMGLTTMRESKDSVLQGEIVQRLRGRAALTDFKRLQNDFVAQGPFYFDSQGMEQDAEGKDTRFVVTPRNRSISSADPVYPGANQVSNLGDNMAIIELQVAMRGDEKVRNFAVYVPNQNGHAQ
jgi:uncharacterized protein (TIGR02598 family)